jgi:hypothetical protein
MQTALNVAFVIFMLAIIGRALFRRFMRFSDR